MPKPLPVPDTAGFSPNESGSGSLGSQSAADKTLSDARIQKVFKSAESLQLPIGWSSDPHDPRYFRFRHPELSLDFATWVLSKLFGLIISIFAVSLGAPFWFDTLSKFMNLRSAGTPPGETKKSAPQPAG